nr:MAG: terminase large subunit [Caudoviricetes sp.]
MMDRATEYARAVVAGRVVAGRDQRNACRRHLRDLDRQATEGFPFRWDPEKANKILEFAEMLEIAEGTEPQKLVLVPFQAFILGSLFGWVDVEGHRRFRVSYVEMARQNGKSFLNGVECPYIMQFSGYRYGQCYTTATKHSQSMIVWNEVMKFIRSDPDLEELFTIKEYNSLITCNDTHCTLEALSRDRQKLDGFRSIWASVDELHQHPDNSIYKAIVNGTGSLKETLISMITTAGFNLNSFCYEMHQYAQRVAEGAILDETFFSCIFALDPDDDYWDPACYIKSNPRLATLESGRKELCDAAARAKEMGGFELRDFLTKRLNVWVQQSDNQYMNAESWQKCGCGKTLEDMRGQRCYVGLDLSSGGDLTSMALEFPLDEGGYYIYSHSFMPAQRLNEHIKTDLAPYDVWRNAGLLTTTDTFGGVKNDYKFIISHLQGLVEAHNIEIVGIAYDTHNADGFLGDLEGFGVPLVAITQSARVLNDATVDLELEVRAGNVQYDKNNALMSWSVLNAKTVKNSFGEVKVDKEIHARHARIDVVDAILDAHTLMLRSKAQEQPVDLTDSMERYLKMMGW